MTDINSMLYDRHRPVYRIRNTLIGMTDPGPYHDSMDKLAAVRVPDFYRFRSRVHDHVREFK